MFSHHEMLSHKNLLVFEDDIWVISRFETFQPEATEYIIAKSTFFGPSSTNMVELEAISGGRFVKELIDSQRPLSALHAFCVNSEFTMTSKGLD